MINSKKILLVVDNERWAFYNIATHLKKELDYYYDIDIISMEKLNGNVIDLFIIGKNYDLIHFFWRGYLLDLDNDFSKSYIYNLGMSLAEFKEKYIFSKKITTSVHDHKILDVEDINRICDYISGYYVISSKLFKIYNKLNIKKKPISIITDAVDLDLFYLNDINKFKDMNRTIRIGWVGNSNWDGKNDHKGLNTIIIPCIEILKKKYNIELCLADSSKKIIPHSEMREYYDKIDLCLCCSISEGTPLPVLEAMACGIPVISTDVGIVKEVFGTKQKKYILKERSVEELLKKIENLLKNKKQFDELSQENLNSIKCWSWTIKSKDFKKFIDYIMKINDNKEL